MTLGGMIHGPAALEQLIKDSIARYEAMTPEQKTAHDYEQRRSFVRGMCPSNRDYKEWCEHVDKILPPLHPLDSVRQPKPVRVSFDGNPIDKQYWLRTFVKGAEALGHNVEQVSADGFTIYPRAVND